MMSGLCSLKHVMTINDHLQLTISTAMIWLFSKNSFQEQNGRPISIEFLPFYPSNNNTKKTHLFIYREQQEFECPLNLYNIYQIRRLLSSSYTRQNLYL
jgi:hypothetical protein